MYIFKAFIPWIVFFILQGYQLLIWGAVSALAIYGIRFVKNPKHIKLLDYASVVFFLVVILFVFIKQDSWFIKNVGLLSNIFLALIILLTLLIKRPFTIEYAKDTVPPEKWNNPHFYRINFIISIAWLVAFLINICVGILLSKVNQDINQLVQLAVLILAIVFTKLFPNQYIKRLK